MKRNEGGSGGGGGGSEVENRKLKGGAGMKDDVLPGGKLVVLSGGLENKNDKINQLI